MIFAEWRNNYTGWWKMHVLNIYIKTFVRFKVLGPFLTIYNKWAPGER
jgi:hypothetical protein